MNKGKERITESAPAIDEAVDFFDANAVELGVDVKDRVADTIVDICSGEGSGGVSRR